MQYYLLCSKISLTFGDPESLMRDVCCYPYFTDEEIKKLAKGSMVSREAGLKILQNGSRHKKHSTLHPTALCLPAHAKECYFLTVFLHFETSNPSANTSLSILQCLLLSAFWKRTSPGALLPLSQNGPHFLKTELNRQDRPVFSTVLSADYLLYHHYLYYLLTRIFLLSSYLSLFNHCHASLWFTFIFLDKFCTHLLSFFLIHFLQLKT